MEVSPNVITYSSILSAWANSGNEEAPHCSENLLYKMQLCQILSNKFLYSCVLISWARSSKAQGPGCTHAIIKHMIKLHQQGCADVKPNAHCWSVVISAYAYCGDAHYSEQILLEQLDIFKRTQDRDFMPNMAGYNAVLNAWARNRTLVAPQTADAILQQMQDLAMSSGDLSLLPNVVSFSLVLKAWAQSTD